MAQGKKLVELFAKKNKISLNFVSGSEEISNFGDDYISYKYRSSSGEKVHKFQFDDLKETNEATQAEGIGRAVCIIYGGTFESRGLGSTLECKNLTDCKTWKAKVKEMADRAMEPVDKAESAKCILKVRL